MVKSHQIDLEIRWHSLSSFGSRETQVATLASELYMCHHAPTSQLFTILEKHRKQMLVIRSLGALLDHPEKTAALLSLAALVQCRFHVFSSVFEEKILQESCTQTCKNMQNTITSHGSSHLFSSTCTQWCFPGPHATLHPRHPRHQACSAAADRDGFGNSGPGSQEPRAVETS